MDKRTHNRLLSSHRNRLFNHAWYCLRDEHAAEDVLQDAFLRLWQSKPPVQPEAAGTWLTKVVHNLCIDAMRRQKSQRKNFGVPVTDHYEHLATSAESSWNPERNLHLDDRQRLLLEAMDTLKPETRSILLMHYFQGLTLAQISKATGKSVSALKVQFHRARKSLRVVLDQLVTPNVSQQRGIG
jgi:RNA polymerase sigma-70 factor, ECF subfamily